MEMLSQHPVSIADRKQLVVTALTKSHVIIKAVVPELTNLFPCHK